MNVRLLRKRREPPPHPVLRGLRIGAGAVVLLAGLVMAIPFVPGQGVLMILAGLWILSADVRLARRVLLKLRTWVRRTRRKLRASRQRRNRARRSDRIL